MGCHFSCLPPSGFSRRVREKLKARSGRFHRTQSHLEDRYLPTRTVLGVGVSGPVRLGASVETEEKVAIKTLRANVMSLLDFEKASKHVAREVELLLSISHPHVVRLLDVFERPASLVLVTELLEGGTLQAYLLEKERLAEEEAAPLARQMLRAVDYLHRNLIIHRDLKPDNFMFCGPGFGEGALKLIDLGFSKHFTPGKLMKSCKGTLAYMAPEVLQHQYTYPSDMWSIGVLLFRCLSGYLPFQDQGAVHPVLAPTFEDKLRDRILRGHVILQDKAFWKTLSSDARQLVRSCLSTDPGKRPSAGEALRHPWLRTLRAQAWSRSLTSIAGMSDSLVIPLRDAAVRGRFARACLALMVWLRSDRTNAAPSPGRHSPDGEGGHACLSCSCAGSFASALSDPSFADPRSREVFRVLESLGRGDADAAEAEPGAVLAALRPWQAELTGGLLAQAFGVLDHGGKGFITMEDLEGAFGSTPWDVAAMWSELRLAPEAVVTYSHFRSHLCAEDSTCSC